MANIKFSQFTAEADIANFDDIVGYQGLVNKRITPANLASSLVTLSGGPYLPLIAGAGNPLTGDLYIGDGTAATVNLFFQTTGVAGDVVEIQSQGAQIIYHEKGTSLDIGTNNDIVIDDSGVGGITLTQATTFQSDIVDINNLTGVAGQVLTSLGGGGAGVEWQNAGSSGYKSLQVFQWTNGNPTAYQNYPIGAPAAFLPFDPTPQIETGTYSGAAGTFAWTCVNVAAAQPPSPTPVEAEFTLGASGAGAWEVKTCQHWFDQNQFLEVNISFTINGTVVDVIDQRVNDGAGDRIYNGYLFRDFNAGDVLKVRVIFANGTGSAPFPSDANNRPIEISFNKIV